MNSRVGVGLFMTVLLWTPGCGRDGVPESGNPDGPPDDPTPSQAFFQLEDRMIQARDLSLEFHVTAEGGVEVDMAGALRFGEGGAVYLDARGVFAGDSVDVLLQTRGDEYLFGNGPGRTTAPTPEFLKEALSVGFTRMGILHNLAMLVADAPPDGAHGGAKDWVRAHDFSHGTPEVSSGTGQPLSFAVTVAGEPAGHAVLEIGPGGLPLERRQNVLFPSGEMRVVERYFSVSISP